MSTTNSELILKPEGSDKCEAELMTNDEVQEYIHDCVATLKVLNDSGSAKLEQVRLSYLADIAVLHAFGRIDGDAYNELKDDAIMRFEA